MCFIHSILLVHVSLCYLIYSIVLFCVFYVSYVMCMSQNCVSY